VSSGAPNQVQDPAAAASQPAAASTRPRYDEIDALKGLAIVSVVLIHAEPLAGTVVHEYLVNRAVPMLIVLFGASSAVWWRGAGARLSSELARTRMFVWERYSRLLPPVWATLVVWWGLRLALPSSERAPDAAPWLLLHGLGYMPQVGTGWFVTLVVQLVLLYPMLHWLMRRARYVALLLTAALHVWSHLYIFDVVELMRAALRDSAHMHGFFVLYYAWIFAPSRLLLVTAGMLFARRDMRGSRKLTLLAAALWLAGCAVHMRLVIDPLQRNLLLATLDIPLTWLCLTAARAVSSWPMMKALRWLGRASWGVYLGQLLVHTTLQLLDYDVLAQPRGVRFAWALLLLLGGLLWVLLGRALPRPWAQGAFERNVSASRPGV
jgi:peptidoglycan/LPS O-acetylase OafA/YrhL